ncbi:hypothetical protein TNIN_457531 [Trichonephila inaurata madagascariensis]|uniref:Uncharacterized protein n=1 Tax=Trichonephila inaurata madagascariensis TaxID=2747483 RepID=A0A8X6WZN4_9ARAC|nr:hypothetical protein TNIN_457531 [Trichonephila inaurata madagascariensis]
MGNQFRNTKGDERIDIFYQNLVKNSGLIEFFTTTLPFKRNRQLSLRATSLFQWETSCPANGEASSPAYRQIFYHACLPSKPLELTHPPIGRTSLPQRYLVVSTALSVEVPSPRQSSAFPRFFHILNLTRALRFKCYPPSVLIGDVDPPRRCSIPTLNTDSA